jgi:hypothetical protein
MGVGVTRTSAAVALGALGAIVGAVAGYVIAINVVLPSNADLAAAVREILPSGFEASTGPSYSPAPFLGASYDGSENWSATAPTAFDDLDLTAENRLEGLGWTPWNSANREGFTSSYGDRPGLRATLAVRAAADGTTRADVAVRRVDFAHTVWLPTGVGTVVVSVIGVFAGLLLRRHPIHH